MVLRQLFPSREVLMQTMQTSRICFRLCGEQADKGGTVPCAPLRMAVALLRPPMSMWNWGTRMFWVSSWWIRIAIGWVLDLPYPFDPNFHETHSPERIWLTWAFTKRELEQLRWGFGDSSVVPTVWGAHTISFQWISEHPWFFCCSISFGFGFRVISSAHMHPWQPYFRFGLFRRSYSALEQVNSAGFTGIALPLSPWLLPVSKSTFKQKD